MATLYKRATPPQARILRIIEGAVKNAADAHGIAFSPRQARSIAKRATGTLTAQWPDVLAAQAPSKKAAKANLTEPKQQAPKPHPIKARVVSYGCKTPESGKSQLSEGFLLFRLKLLEKWMTRQMRQIKIDGNTERLQAFIDVLRKIDELKH